MFELKEDSAFKQHLRDFLVQTKSFADKNNADLFAEEAAQQREVGNAGGFPRVSAVVSCCSVLIQTESFAG